MSCIKTHLWCCRQWRRRLPAGWRSSWALLRHWPAPRWTPLPVPYRPPSSASGRHRLKPVEHYWDMYSWFKILNVFKDMDAFIKCRVWVAHNVKIWYVCQVGGPAAQRPGGVNWASALILWPISANRGSIDSCQSDLSFVFNDIYRFTET